MQFGACDLCLQRGDARFKLLDRQGIKVMTGKRIRRIARPTGEVFVGLHVVNVDPAAAIVNDRREPRAALSG